MNESLQVLLLVLFNIIMRYRTFRVHHHERRQIVTKMHENANFILKKFFFQHYMCLKFGLDKMANTINILMITTKKRDK